MGELWRGHSASALVVALHEMQEGFVCDIGAQIDAFVANEDAGTGNQLSHVRKGSIPEMQTPSPAQGLGLMIFQGSQRVAHHGSEWFNRRANNDRLTSTGGFHERWTASIFPAWRGQVLPAW
jgi:hypothetical protein